MSGSEDDFAYVNVHSPPEIEESDTTTIPNSLPAKSREKYESVYEKFLEWKKKNNITTVSENVLMTYFGELSANFKPSTLWSQYSMLKSTISAKDNVDISAYRKLNLFLKRQSSGFKSKTSNVLTSNEVEEFLNKAPDKHYLATKVALILGVTGACRREELCNITVNDITDNGSMALIMIPRTRTNLQRSFTVIGEFYKIFKKYASLRPKNAPSNRFFYNYKNGKCTQQVIGINKFGGMPKQIALYLNLPDPQSYTGHSFRRTSATLLADSGATLTTLKRHRGWKENQVTEGYTEDSLDKKIRISEQITESVHIRPSTFNPVNVEAEPTHDTPSPERRISLESESTTNSISSFNFVDIKVEPTLDVTSPERRKSDDSEFATNSPSNYSLVGIKVEPTSEVPSPKRTEDLDNEFRINYPPTFCPVDIKVEPTFEVSSPEREDVDDEFVINSPSISSSDGNKVNSVQPTLKVASSGRNNKLVINYGASTSKKNFNHTSTSKKLCLSFNQCSNITINFIVKKD